MPGGLGDEEAGGGVAGKEGAGGGVAGDGDELDGAVFDELAGIELSETGGAPLAHTSEQASNLPGQRTPQTGQRQWSGSATIPWPHPG